MHFYKVRKWIDMYTWGKYNRNAIVVEQMSLQAKNASRKWYLQIVEKLKELNFQTCKYDSGLYFLIKNGKTYRDRSITCWWLFACRNELKYCYSSTTSRMFQNWQIRNKRIYVERVSIVPRWRRHQIKSKQICEERSNSNNRCKTEEDRKQEINNNMEELSLLRQMTGVVNWTARATCPDLKCVSKRYADCW